MGRRVFEPVWYLPSENRWRAWNPLAFKDVGKLIVSDHAIEFQGRGQKVAVSQIRSVSIGKQGRDFVNDWVKVEYGPGPTPATAFFADGSVGAACSEEPRRSSPRFWGRWAEPHVSRSRGGYLEFRPGGVDWPR